MILLGDVLVRIVGEEVPTWHRISKGHEGTKSIATCALSCCSGVSYDVNLRLGIFR